MTTERAQPVSETGDELLPGPPCGAAAGPAHTLLQTALDTYRREHHTLPAG
jgi:hypothetical protein